MPGISAANRTTAVPFMRSPSVGKWRAWQESNLRPAASKSVPGAFPEGTAASQSASSRPLAGDSKSPAIPPDPLDPAEFGAPVVHGPEDASGGLPRVPGHQSGPTMPTKQTKHGVPLRVVPSGLLSVRQVATQLGVCRETIYRLISRGDLPYVRIGCAVRV